MNGKKTLLLQIFLFIATFLTTTIFGFELVNGKFCIDTEGNITAWGDEWIRALQYSISFLGILTVHEFGHYFTARYYQIRSSLPYYIPFVFIGTMGAFIRMKEQSRTNKEMFDIGVAGPLAGFIAALGVIVYGFVTLPPPEYIFSIHPEYLKYGLDYPNYVYNNKIGLYFSGDNLLFSFFRYFISDPARIPVAYELMHYPFLLSGFLACFFTSLNLLPVGQLDGGHVTYGLFGERKHNIIAKYIYVIFVFYVGLGLVTPTVFVTNFNFGIILYAGLLFLMFSKLTTDFKTNLTITLAVFIGQFATSYFYPGVEGFNSLFLFAFILGRVIGINHPPALVEEPLDLKRKVIGIIALIVFIISFSPKPFIVD